MAAGSDFVQVRLTELGTKLAEGNCVRVHSGPHDFVFKPGEIQRVTRAFDWERVLQNQLIDGQPLFELAPETPAKPEKTKKEEK